MINVIHHLLQSNLDMLDEMLKVSDDLIVLHGLDGSYLKVSDSCKNVTTWNKEDLYKIKMNQIIYEKDMPVISEKMQHLYNTGEVVVARYRILTKDDNLIWLESNAGPIFDENGEIKYMFSISTNITTDQNQKISIEIAKERAHIGTWEYHPLYGELVWDRQTYEIHKLSASIKISAAQSINFYQGEYRSMVEKSFNNLLKNGKSFDHIAQIKTARGDLAWVRILGQAEFFGNQVIRAYGTIQDITQDVESRLLLQKQEEHLNIFIEEAPAPIAVFNEDMIYLKWSKAWEEFFQIRNESLIGENYDSFAQSVGVNLIHYYKDVLTKKETISHDAEEFQINGKKIWINSRVKPWYRSDGSLGGVVAFIQDVTSQVEFNRELRRARIEAEKSNKAKDDFLSTISHEIRTPLNAVVGITQLLMQNDPKPEQTQYLNNLKFSSEHLLSLINDILDFSKLETDSIDLVRQRFNMKDLCLKVKNTMESMAKRKKLALSLKYDIEIPEKLIGDENRIFQVLSNLVSNAIKFTNKGQVIIDCELLEKEEEKAKIKISVIDTGIGIPEEKMDQVFERFRQLSSPDSEKSPGVGLGLAISKQILEAMGSEIQVDSEVGIGSTFSFVLELERLEDSNKQIETEEVQEKKDLDIYVLLVEDHEINQFVAVKILESWNVTVDVANNGVEGLEKYNRNNYDLVLMDLQMPIMNGYECFQKIIETEKYKHDPIPIFALTASALPHTRNKVLRMGFTDHITKPIDGDHLYQRIVKEINSKNIQYTYQIKGAENFMKINDQDYQRFIIENSVKNVDVNFDNLIRALRYQDYYKIEDSLNEMRSNLKFWHLTDLINDIEAIADNIRSHKYQNKDIHDLTEKYQQIKAEIKEQLSKFRFGT